MFTGSTNGYPYTYRIFSIYIYETEYQRYTASYRIISYILSNAVILRYPVNAVTFAINAVTAIVFYQNVQKAFKLGLFVWLGIQQALITYATAFGH